VERRGSRAHGGHSLIRILIADDHPVVRQGIRQIVSATRDIVVADDVTDGRQVLAATRATSPDLILLDLSMPGQDGLDVLKQLKRERPKTPVLILTMHSEDQFAVRALKAGAAGYLTKDSAPDELVDAIRKVVAGGRYVSPWLAEKLVDHLGPDSEKPRHERLSDREYQILRMIAAGKSTRDISTLLSLSVKTVGTYRSRIFEKMGFRTTAEVATYVIRNRLAE
jgi:two-component system, NarL family, invasion response regulator UvrY